MFCVNWQKSIFESCCVWLFIFFKFTCNLLWIWVCREICIFSSVTIVNHWFPKMGKPSKNHRCRWLIPPKTINGDGEKFSKTIAIPSLRKYDHRHSIATKNWPSFQSNCEIWVALQETESINKLFTQLSWNWPRILLIWPWQKCCLLQNWIFSHFYQHQWGAKVEGNTKGSNASCNMVAQFIFSYKRMLPAM